MIRALAKFLFAACLIVVSISIVVEMKYGISMTEYLAYSAPLTHEEQQYLKEREYLAFGVDNDDGPFLHFNAETGQWEGLMADYMSFLSLELSTDIRWETVESSQMGEALINNQIHLSDFFADSDQKRYYIHTQPLYELKAIMVTLYKNEKFREYRDLHGEKIAVVEGDFMESKVLECFPKGESIDFVRVRDVKEGLQLLAQKKVAALVADEILIESYAAELDMDNQLRRIGGEIYREEVTLGVNIFDRKLCNILNKKILDIKKSHNYTEAQTKWLGSQAAMVTNSASVAWVQWIIFACVGFVILAMIWESLMNRKIDQKTRELQIEKNNLQTTIDNIDALVAILNEDDVVTQCNQQGKNLLQDPKGSFIGCGLNTIDILKDLHRQYQENPQELYHHYNGRYYTISMRAIGNQGSNRLLIIQDHTDQSMAERKIRQESKMIAVGQLSAGLAHEIRNPLGLIRNYAYILRDYASDDMAEHALSVIGESSDRIDRMIENLLSFSRLSTDEPVALDLGELLQGILDLSQKKLEKGSIRCSLSCPKGCKVRMREETLKMAAFNLIDNAIDAFSESGQTDKQLNIKARITDGTMELIISDNGPGMPEEVMEHIFNPFYTTKDTGTGLGLYIVSSELAKSNGTISVESTPEVGTTFTIKLPTGSEG